MKRVSWLPAAILAAAIPVHADEPLDAWSNAPGHTRDGAIVLTGNNHGAYYRAYRCKDYETASFVVSIVEKAHIYENTAAALREIFLISLAKQGCEPAAAGRYRPLELGNVSVINNGPEAEEEWTALRVSAQNGDIFGLIYDASVFAIGD